MQVLVLNTVVDFYRDKKDSGEIALAFFYDIIIAIGFRSQMSILRVSMQGAAVLL